MRFFYAPFFPVIGRKEGENDKGKKHSRIKDQRMQKGNGSFPGGTYRASLCEEEHHLQI